MQGKLWSIARKSVNNSHKFLNMISICIHIYIHRFMIITVSVSGILEFCIGINCSVHGIVLSSEILSASPGTDPVTSGTDPVTSGADPLTPGMDPVTSWTDPVTPGTDPVTSEGTTTFSVERIRKITHIYIYINITYVNMYKNIFYTYMYLYIYKFICIDMFTYMYEYIYKSLVATTTAHICTYKLI
jgi:hypothetical protein